MSSQRYSLSAELTHIVCSRRHLPALLSVMAGSICPLYHRNQGRVKTLAAWASWEGRRVLTTSGGCLLQRGRPRGGGGSGLALQTRDAGWESQEFTMAKSLKRFFLFWAILSSPSGHTYPKTNPRLAEEEAEQRASRTFKDCSQFGIILYVTVKYPYLCLRLQQSKHNTADLSIPTCPVMHSIML